MGSFCSKSRAYARSELKKIALDHLDKLADFHDNQPTRIDLSFHKKITQHSKISHEQITWKNTVPFIPPIKNAVVIKVYDGDTITIACKLPFDDNLSPIYRFNVRLS